MKQGQLDEVDHGNLEAFLDVVLHRHGAKELDSATAKSVLLPVMSALDSGDIHEVRRWIEEGRPAAPAR